MTPINIPFFDSEAEKKAPIEEKLLHFYLLAEFVWTITMGLLSIPMGLPLMLTKIYLGLAIGLFVFYFLAHISTLVTVFREAYFIRVLTSTPVLWYFSGGFRTSGNILFVVEIILFVLCMKGFKQKLYILLAMISTALTQNMAPRLPVPVYPMTDAQYAKCSSILGLLTTLLIASLLIKQKTEYMRERDAVIKSEKELERSNQLQKHFLANMSHEIRSPLGIVMGFNNLIGDSNNIEQIHEYSKDIKQAGSTLLAVINDILDYSKIESGKLDIIETNYSFRSLITGINRDIGLKCDENGLSYVTEIDDEIPDWLLGDSIRIKQCLINILSNSVKYTEKGTVSFAIKCVEKDAESCTIKFAISDTGKGISKEALPNLYTAFQRLDEGANRGVEGTGLGLAITKNLLDEMNGTIEVESELGHGTTFTIVLSQKIASAESSPEGQEENIDISGVNVLAVDDTLLNLTLVKKLLLKENASVTTISNGKDCLIDLETNKYDIILLDHMMPEMNGVEVFNRIKASNGINKDTPIVMLTANAMAGAMKEYLDMGFDGYISKPIVHHDLKETIFRLAKAKQ